MIHWPLLVSTLKGSYIFITYCDASNNLWILDFMLALLGTHQAEFTISYYSLNLTVNTLR
jgi:hypothetical protein